MEVVVVCGTIPGVSSRNANSFVSNRDIASGAPISSWRELDCIIGPEIDLRSTDWTVSMRWCGIAATMDPPFSVKNIRLMKFNFLSVRIGPIVIIVMGECVVSRWECCEVCRVFCETKLDHFLIIC